MTQILAILTAEYVVVASDRRLTFKDGRVADDDTCKLVSMCGAFGISYTGLALLEGKPTHEWIAIELAKANCSEAGHAASVLASSAERAIKKAPLLTQQTFLISGWGKRTADTPIYPQFNLISNVIGIDKQELSAPARQFTSFQRILKPNELYAARVVGCHLPEGRGKTLDRELRRRIERRVGPKSTMEMLVAEIINTSKTGAPVGEKVLAYSIPRNAAEQVYRTRGNFQILAKEPDFDNAAFCYFDGGYSQLEQYGPTVVCGENAYTDFKTEQDDSRDYQSSSVRILHTPKKRR